MRGHFRTLFLFAIIVLLCSCASVDTYPYERGAIRVHLKGDPELNLFKGSPHTVVVWIYQLRDPNGFIQHIDDPNGLSKLLEGGRFDPSVTYYKMLVLQPGEDVSEILDRAEGTTYVGFVAGYYVLEKDRVVRLYEIPRSMIRKKPKKLNIDLVLGPQKIEETKGK